MDIWAFVLLVGLIARATRLITADAITAPLRNAVAGPQPADAEHMTTLEKIRGVAAYWISCPWCIGLPIAVGGAASWWYWGHTPWWQIIALGATANTIYATTTTAYGKLDALIGHLLTLANRSGGRPPARPGGR